MRYIFFIPVEWIFMGFIAICIGCNVYLAHKDPSTITTVAGFVLIAGYVAIIVALIETVAEIFIDVGKLKAVAAFPILLLIAIAAGAFYSILLCSKGNSFSVKQTIIALIPLIIFAMVSQGFRDEEAYKACYISSIILVIFSIMWFKGYRDNSLEVKKNLGYVECAVVQKDIKIQGKTNTQTYEKDSILKDKLGMKVRLSKNKKAIIVKESRGTQEGTNSEGKWEKKLITEDFRIPIKYLEVHYCKGNVKPNELHDLLYRLMSFGTKDAKAIGVVE